MARLSLPVISDGCPRKYGYESLSAKAKPPEVEGIAVIGVFELPNL